MRQRKDERGVIKITGLEKFFFGLPQRTLSTRGADAYQDKV
jgi:hypothetical protein